LAEKFGFEVDVAKHEDWARDDFSPSCMREFSERPSVISCASQLRWPRLSVWGDLGEETGLQAGRCGAMSAQAKPLIRVE
jgi:hypothetical protein